MSFARNDYLTWYMPRIMAGPVIDLSSSGVAALQPGDIAVPEVDPWQAGHLFEGALAEWLSVPAESILFTPGATGGTLLALLELARPGGEILVEAPIYEPMLRQGQRLGGTVRRFQRNAENSWQIDLDEVAAQLGPRSSVVMITEPSNPSGTFLPREQVLALADAAARVGAVLLINEVYLGFSAAPSYHGAADNIVVVSSTSKLLGTYWARLGWVSAATELLQRLRHAHLNMGMQASPAAVFGLGLMASAGERRELARDLAQAGRCIVQDWVEATPGVSWTTPAGPGFGCIRLPDHLDDDVRFAESLHDEQGVLTVPGAHFEMPGHLRVSWLQAGDRLREGLSRLTAML